MSDNKLIHKESDYSKFSLIDANRDINTKKVADYVKMIEDGYSHDECPILVTKNLEILDGQHRFLAAKTLGTPIYYIISKKTADSNAMIDINKYTSTWTLGDYIKTFSLRGNLHYQNLKNFCTMYHISFSIGVLCFGYQRKQIKKIITSGDFEYNETIAKEQGKWLDNYRQFLSRVVMSGDKKFYNICASFSFLEAVISAKNKKEDFFDILFAVRSIIQRVGGFREYIRQFYSLGASDE